MEELAEQTGETITLALPAGTQVVTVSQVDGRHFVTSGNWVGIQTPPHCCSDGKVLLAFGAVQLPPGRLSRPASHTITNRRELEAELAEVRRVGYATADGELEEGLIGVAVPVRRGSACVAALCISGPGYRLDAATVRDYVPACAEAASRIGS
jgi:DNA-binding IclR family transcriptional regulator